MVFLFPCEWAKVGRSGEEVATFEGEAMRTMAGHAATHRHSTNFIPGEQRHSTREQLPLILYILQRISSINHTLRLLRTLQPSRWHNLHLNTVPRIHLRSKKNRPQRGSRLPTLHVPLAHPPRPSFEIPQTHPPNRLRVLLYVGPRQPRSATPKRHRLVNEALPCRFPGFPRDRHAPVHISDITHLFNVVQLSFSSAVLARLIYEPVTAQSKG